MQPTLPQAVACVFRKNGTVVSLTNGQQFRQIADIVAVLAFDCLVVESVGIRFAVFDVGQEASSFFPSHAVAFEGDAVGVVDDPVEDCICDGWLADHIVTLGNGQLGGNQGGFAPVALFEDFQEIEALLVIERVGAPVVEDEQLDPRELVDEAWEATVEACQGEIFEQAWHTQIEDGMIEPGCLASEGTSQPGFSGSGQTGDDEVLMGFQPGALGQLQGVAPVKAAAGCEVDVFDTGFDEAQLGCGQPIGQTPVGAHGGFAIEHQAEPLVAAEIGHCPVRPIAGRPSPFRQDQVPASG